VEEREPSQYPQTSGQTATAISNAVVSLFASYTGRGPTRARTALDPNVVTVVLQDTFTKAERRLIEVGEEAAVVSTRRTFQQVMKVDLVAAVEHILSRTVVAFLSDQSAEPDMAVEVFVLQPVVLQPVPEPATV
jgi:uncharacterized protein YbcI